MMLDPWYDPSPSKIDSKQQENKEAMKNDSFIQSLTKAITATQQSGLDHATFIRRLCGALDVPLESLTNKESAAVQKPTVAANLGASPTSTDSFVSKVPTYPHGVRS